MSAPAKLAGFAAVLAALFGGGALAGAALGPDRDGSEPAETMAHGTPAETAPSHGDGGEPAAAHGDDGAGHGAGAPGDDVRGLASAQDGLRLQIATPELRRGRDERLAFTIIGPDGRPVDDFDVTHTKRMHVIVVRRDLTGFQHLHPARRPDGTWAAPLRLDEAGSYRVFADFSHDGEARTLAGDLRVDGAADLQALPPSEPVARTADGYEVRLTAQHARAGEEADLRFAITKDGRPVHTEPYLGAGGHLVALREGDLAFLHVHPVDDEHGEEPGEPHDDAIGFAATFPTEGRYRLFLQFKADGKVHTVAFTQEVER